MKKILCIHGIGGVDSIMSQWIPGWKKSITALAGTDSHLKFCFLKMDDLFTESRIRMGGIRYLEAVACFVRAWVESIQRETLSETDYSEVIRWTAGMPAQFITDDLLRARIRNRLAIVLRAYRPDLVYAHSLGSLVLYDLLRKKNPLDPMDPFVVLTSGTQLGHPAISSLFGDRLDPIQSALWINLHNEKDRVFAFRSIDLKAPNFLEVNTPFEKRILNHAALSYLNHKNTRTIPWHQIWNNQRITNLCELTNRKIQGY